MILAEEVAVKQQGVIMNRLQLSAVVGLVSLGFFSPGLKASDNRPRCRPNVPRVVPAPIRVPGNAGAPLPAPGADPEDGDDSVVWDLPEGPKSRNAKRPAVGSGSGEERLRAVSAVRSGSRPPAPANPADRRVPAPEHRAIRPPAEPVEGEPKATATRAEGRSYSDRVTRAVVAQQALAAENARLEAKPAELERWDAVARDKFRRAFGTTDERMRQLVYQRIEQCRKRWGGGEGAL
jgi:hypothetical protein